MSVSVSVLVHTLVFLFLWLDLLSALCDPMHVNEVLESLLGICKAGCAAVCTWSGIFAIKKYETSWNTILKFSYNSLVYLVLENGHQTRMFPTTVRTNVFDWSKYRNQ